MCLCHVTVLQQYTVTLLLYSFATQENYKLTWLPPGHELAVDLQHDQLYCAACNTYVHDAAFTAAIQVRT